jgi:sugar lactone lactonase YvrE
MPNIGPAVGVQPFKPVFGVGKIVTEDLKLDFRAKSGVQGRPYRSLFAIGRNAEGPGDLPQPFALASLPGGDFCVLHAVDESGRTRLVRFGANGARVGEVGTFEGGSGESALDAPAAFQIDAQDNILIVDMGTGLLKKFSPEGRLLARWGGPGSGPGQLEMPEGLAVDAVHDILYIADTGNGRVQKWDAEGRFLSALRELDEPRGICLDADGDLYVADSSNHRIRKFGADGQVRLVFGEEGQDPGQLYYPRVVRVNALRDIFVADAAQGRIQKFNADGQFVFQIAMPEDAGQIDDFLADDAGRVLVALRHSDLVLNLEVE